MKDLGGGAVLDLGIYMLQLLHFVYKEPPTDIMCTGHLSKSGVDESMSCAFKYRDGRTATIAAHTRATMANRAEITGNKGTILVSFRTYIGLLFCFTYNFVFHLPLIGNIALPRSYSKHLSFS